jgi:hypothetical protein
VQKYERVFREKNSKANQSLGYAEQAEQAPVISILWRKRPKKIEPAAPKFGA